MGYSCWLISVHWNKTDSCHCKGREFTVEYPLEVNMLRSSAGLPTHVSGKKRNCWAQVDHPWARRLLRLPAVPEPTSSRWPPCAHAQGCTRCSTGRLCSGSHCSLRGYGHGLLYLARSDFTAHCEVCLFFLFITLMLFLTLYFLLESQRERIEHDRALAISKSRDDALVGYGVKKHSCLKGLWESLLPDGQSLSWHFSQCVYGGLGHAQTNFSLPWDQWLPSYWGAPDPSFQCIPKAPRCWHPASPNNCCKQLAANRPTLGPLSPASPLHDCSYTCINRRTAAWRGPPWDHPQPHCMSIRAC